MRAGTVRRPIATAYGGSTDRGSTGRHVVAQMLIAIVLVGCSAGCSGGEAGSAGRGVTEESGVTATTSSTVVATDLAPSQVAAPTVPEPAKPPPCDLADLDLWTAQMLVGDTTADAVIRVRNNGRRWCKADIGRSPFVDPRMEPDVWLDPGATADLVVGQALSACDDPVLVSVVPIAIDGEEVAVPSAVVACEWWLTAYYPNDTVLEPCVRGQLDRVATDSAVVVRNASTRPCLLADVTDVIDDDPIAVVATDGEVVPDVVAVHQMFPGDVVAFGRIVRESCDDPPRRVVLVGAVADGLDVDGAPCRLGFEPGAGRPWYGTPDDPSAAASAGGIAAALRALVPFDGTDDRTGDS